MKYKSKIIDGKMMLISRDITQGDNVFCPAMQRANESVPEAEINPYFTIKDEEDLEHARLTFCIKVIGEISNQATWIVEGDEFELKHFNPLSAADIEHKGSTKQVIRIKGPCGHYH